ncbi:MAG: radical SAM protein [Theionarchaea archaeon]|nr:radical SAM protein [Theionarchaea archaeon]MBU7035143.1 radical SAM protein [Theionarchaea archaeon]MBU7040758.1 radical SAM protein [Theionarchaea archaeon]
MNRTHLSAPNSIIWDVTNRCNLNCRHCYVEATPASVHELTTREAMTIIDQVVRAKVFRLSFSGGEPLLRKDIFDLIQYAAQWVPVELATNGMLIYGEEASALKSSGVSMVQLSLDGLEEAHDYLRKRQGAFQRVLEATGILKEAGIPFGVTTVVYRKNFSEITELVQLAEKLGAFTIRFYRLIYTGRAAEMSSMDLTPTEYRWVLEEIYGYKGTIHAVADEAFGFLLHGKENPHQWVGCQAGRTLAGIKANGQVVPCPMFDDPAFYCGSVLDQDFRKIWAHSPVMARFRALDKIHGKCSSCTHLHQCGGGCRAAVYAKTHDLYASDYQCFVEGDP